MQPLEVNDFVETPMGNGVIVNFAYDRDRQVTRVLVRMDDGDNVDRDWRAFPPEEVKKA